MLRAPIVNRYSCTLLLLVAATASFSAGNATTGDEPTGMPSTAGTAGQLDPNDPLVKALETLQRDADELRSSLGKPPGNQPPSTGMSRPQQPGRMSAPPQMNAPASGMSSPSSMGGPAPVPAVRTSTLPNVVLKPSAVAKSDHWSFQPVRKPTTPTVRDAAWPRSDLDRFILAQIEAAGLQPAADAAAETLCRRIYLDLTGLPPTVEELEAFIRDAGRATPAARDQAYTALVDKLLASPRFGERWARHWLDVVRYADSVGRAWNAPFTYAWRYRDYVVDAFNADVGYDRFIAEQLAGDLLSSNDPDERRAQLTGCGMLGLGSVDLQAASNAEFVMDQIDDQIDVVTRAFLGLTVSCARCHDHKYEPISMRDYYALAGIFYSTRTLSGQAQCHEQGGGGYVDAERLVRLPRSKSGDQINPDDVGRPIVHSMSDYRAEWSVNRRDPRYTTDPNLAMGATEGNVADCELRLRGEAYDLGPTVPRGDMRIPSLPRMPSIPPGVSGRLELARWIGSPQHPLTARVMSNRIWQHLLGQGLVRTVDDFGATGEAATHPELLDWLASEFVREKWSMKKLIRTIVLSRTYQLASTKTDAGEKLDPHNRLWWRSNQRALELEPLRDSMLFVAGSLETERPYGIQVAGTGGKPGNRALLGFDAPHRTIYLPIMRAHVPDVYGVFNFPEPTQIQGSRAATTVAPQALFFMNDRFAVECAESAARRLLEESPRDPVARLRLAYLRLYGRAPTTNEVRTAGTFVAALQSDPSGRDDELYRWTVLTQALMAGAEFRYVR
jgi:hypothetical protein